MKKVKNLIAVAALLLCLSLASCGGHEHAYTEWACGENYHWMVCDEAGCDSQSQYGKHTYGESGIYTPSCTVGTVCTICGYDSSNTAQHEWDEGTVAIRPTPTEKGKMVYSCVNCDAEKSSEIESVNMTLPETPFEISGNMGAQFSITEMTPSYTEEGHFLVTVTGTKTTYYSSSVNSSCVIEWKLYDESGLVAASGVYESPSILVGEIFRTTFVIEVDTSKIYDLQIIK